MAEGLSAIETPHGCGMCGEPLRAESVERDGSIWFVCTADACQAAHTSEDCCHEQVAHHILPDFTDPKEVETWLAT